MRGRHTVREENDDFLRAWPCPQQCRLRGGAKPYHIEGTADGTWSLLDYGSFIVHVFQPETRDYYRLESLWNDAPLVDLEGEAGLTDLTYSERIAKLVGREA